MRVVGTRIPTVGEDRKIYSTVDSTATAGQTVFAVNYDEGKVACWLNGIRLVQGQDFTYTASGVGSQIALTSGIVANDYVEVVGYQGIYSGNALVEDRFVVGTNSTGSGGAYDGSAGNHTTVFPVANNTGDLVCVYRNGIKLVHTTDFVVSASGNTVTLQGSGANTADEITVHVIGILQHSNFVPVTGGTFTGTVAHTGDITFGDNNKAKFGAGNDLQIYHDGSNSYVDDAGTGRLYLRGNDRVQIQKYTGEDMVTAQADGTVKLYYDNAKKIETTSTGVAVTGNLTTTGNVGIGETSPTSNDGWGKALEISDANGVDLTLNHTDSNASQGIAQISFTRDATTLASVNGVTGSTTGKGELNFRTHNGTSNATRMVIDEDGKVGIGTTSPDANILTGITSGSNSANIYLGATGTGNAELVLDASNGDFSGSDYYMLRQLNSLDVEHWLGTSGNHIFKTGAGTERMRISSDGTITKPYQPCFLIKATGHTNLSINAYNDISFNTEILDKGGDFDTSTHTFTAPVTGAYQLQVQLYLQALDADATFYQSQIVASNRTLVAVLDFNRETGTADPDYWHVQISTVMDMDGGDTAKVQIYQGGGTAQTDLSGSSYFSGFLIG